MYFLYAVLLRYDSALRRTAGSHGRSLPIRLRVSSGGSRTVAPRLRTADGRRRVWVLHAANGQEASTLSSSLSAPPDVIVADYLLGDGSNGVDVVEALRDLFDHPIPALVISGDLTGRPERAAADSSCRFLEKPFRPGEL